MPRKATQDNSGIAVGDRLRTVFEKHVLFVVIVIYAAGVGTGLGAAHFLARVSVAAKPTAREDVVTLTALSEVLHDNQASNALYAEFRKTAAAQTPFSDYFRTFETVLETKQRLARRLREFQPTPRFVRIYEILTESLLSDAKLMTLEKQSLQHTLDALKVMQVPSTLPDASLPEEERRRRALEALNQVRLNIKQWLEQSRKSEAALNTTRAISSTALQLLNDEVRQLGLPFQHENPFGEKIAALPSPGQVPAELAPIAK